MAKYPSLEGRQRKACMSKVELPENPSPHGHTVDGNAWILIR